ncbi:MAG TPA: DUF1365 domain-containing protein [Steroidobacteraceae bacterium]|nr:DUF1365 domain-containing protein [Steroidobacteraceae bacterium]
MHSALYTGRLRHRRFAPEPHAFEYRLFMVWLDLAELDQVFGSRWLWSTRRPALAWLRRADYLGDARVPLDQAVRDLVERETGARPSGPIRLLTHLRYFGHCFNPVSFYYCYDPAGRNIEAIVAEITNTPWRERHTYVLPAQSSLVQGAQLHFRFGKCFHVSPFMPMDIDYDWRFTNPARRLAVHMTSHRGGKGVFDATLMLERREISGASLAGALARFPLVTLSILGAIYWQALRLWAKRAAFHVHPSKRVEEQTI